MLIYHTTNRLNPYRKEVILMSIIGMSIGIIIGTILGLFYNRHCMGYSFGIIGGSVMNLMFFNKNDESSNSS